MIGLRRGQYSLARVGDVGGYHAANCRFLPIEQNVAERKEGYQKAPQFRALMSKIALARKKVCCEHCGKETQKGMFVRWHGDNCKYKPQQETTP